MQEVGEASKTGPKDSAVIAADFDQLKKTNFKRMHHYPPISMGFKYDDQPSIERLWGSGNKEASLYLHLPFCVAKCKYCPFFACTGSTEQEIDNYIDLLLKEADMYKGAVSTVNYTSLYFGGGTPTYLNEKQLSRAYDHIAKNFNVEKADFTVEANPLTINEKKMQHLKTIGVTRVSLGIQTFNERIIKIIGRYTPKEKISNALEMINKVGFKDFNLDLMYGLPEQTQEIWEEDIENFIKINAPSLTIYRTGYFPAALKEFTTKGYRIPDDDDVDAMYRFAFERLNKAGYVQPHIGSTFFMRTGINSNRENILFGRSILGLGASAYSAGLDYQYQNVATMDAYRERVMSGRPPIGDIVEISAQDKVPKYLIETLKLGYVDKNIFKNLFNASVADVFPSELETLKEMGFILEDGKEITLTFEGVRYLKEISFLFVDKGIRKQLAIPDRR
jgi:putative oxygen-independent coproporphyrinogen III oxidase